MKDEKKVPKLRFKGFTDDWEQVKYGEIFQRRSKMCVSTPALPSVEYDDINPGMGTLNKDPKSKGTSKRGIHFNPGDVLFGKLRPYLKNWLFARFEGVAVGDFWVLTSSKIDHGFTYSLIQAPGFQYIANLSSGSKMPRSDWGLVSNARTFIPTNLSEQESISSVLFGLDTTITLHEEKKHQLERLKSALLQKMFADESGYPVVRFEGFSDEWEQRKLGEVADVRDGTHDSPRYINEGYPLLTSKNVDNGYINYDDVKYVSENDYVQINKRSKVDINDILMGMIGTIGNLALIREEPDFAIKNVALIKHTSNFDYQFLFQELQTSAISKELLSGMDGGTQKFVSLKKIRNLSVMLPSENEQKQIGAFFKQFDSLIALHQRKLDLLKEQKKGFLQKMFI
ncbi:restriction endonuclease subunit S [Lactobacillus delbrueckii]|uniref:restriction endonuclease subunit S n=2 Tax=Lactobacillus delbrueckii TaxID=1584 RepID=UPI0038530007